MNPSTSLSELVESRKALRETIKEFMENKNVVLIAPTGYGKTILSLKLIEVARKQGFSSGLIHVVPYRALVREIYNEKFKNQYPNVGYQSLDDISKDKSPYYLRELVVTTLDSFIYNLYKVPVAEMYKIIGGEKTLGHYYPVLASIFTSTIVFDEAHVYLGSELISGDASELETLAFMLAALDFLIKMNIPLVIETATMHSDVIAEIVDRLKYSERDYSIIYVGQGNSQINNLEKKTGKKIYTIKDESFEEKHGFKWKTIIDSRDNVFKYIEEVCKSEPVLVIHNSIKRAVETYKALSRKCESAVLLHSLLSNKDRERALEKITSEISEKNGVIVSTQVVEAGVDIGARILVSEPAPIENLAQRAGRLCREKFNGIFNRCKNEGAEIHIIKGDPREIAEVYNESRVSKTMELLSDALKNDNYRVNWRLLSVEKPTISFTEILEGVVLKDQMNNLRRILSGSAYKLAEMYLNSDGQPDALIGILDELGRGLTRSSILVNVLIPQYNQERLCNLEFVTVDLARLVRREKSASSKCLDYVVDNNKYYLKLILEAITDNGLELVEARTRNDLDEIERKISRSRYREASKILTNIEKLRVENIKGVVGSFLVAKKDCYIRGEGLAIW